MTFLVDTNVLLRLATPNDERHLLTRRATEALKARGESLVTTSQNPIETWNVATRPQDKNGLGLQPAEAHRLVRKLEQGFPLLEDPPDLYSRWLALVVSFGVSGVQVHDARLVAVMVAQGVSDIFTYNTKDFQRYTDAGIRTTDPATC